MWSKKGTFVQVNIEWPQTKTFQFNFKKYIVDVLWGQPIKLTQVASNSELREIQWNDLFFL